MKNVEEKRKSPVRRQVNEAFCGPDGRVSVAKTLAVFSQIVVLYHLSISFDQLIGKWDSLLVVLAFLIAPDTIKKLISMKYGGAPKGA